MAVNSNPSLLDSTQITKRTFDSDNDAIRVVLGDATGLAMELDADDGDNIMVIGTTDGTTSGTQKVVKVSSDGTVQVAGAVTVTSGAITNTAANSSTKASATSATTGSVIAATSCAGMSTFNVFVKTTATITDAQVLTLEVSPHASDDVWKATALTVTPSTTADVVVMGTPLTGIVASRVRVTTAAAITAGTYDAYLVMRT